jgi:hypothetical protein
MPTKSSPLIEQIIPGKLVFEAKFEKLENIKTEALVGLDASVLLVPYRLDPISLKDIKTVYSSLRDQNRLIVPAQAAREFALNRSARLAELAQALLDQSSRINPLMTEKRSFLEDDEDYKQVIDSAKTIQEHKRKIDKQIAKIANRFQKDIGDDPVSQVYQSVFGQAVRDVVLDPQTFETEMKERYEQKLPPGYKDATKNDGGRGDLIIWKTILQEGKQASSHFIFVTHDEKQDWYVQGGGAFQPRPELLFEYYVATNGKTLHLVSLSQLLRLFDVRDATIKATKEAETSALQANVLREFAESNMRDRLESAKQLSQIELELADALEQTEITTREIAAIERKEGATDENLALLDSLRLELRRLNKKAQTLIQRRNWLAHRQTD